MAKFHINKKGEPGACSAEKGNCPFGSEEEHFSSLKDAQAKSELLLSEANQWNPKRKENEKESSKELLEDLKVQEETLLADLKRLKKEHDEILEESSNAGRERALYIASLRIADPYAAFAEKDIPVKEREKYKKVLKKDSVYAKLDEKLLETYKEIDLIEKSHIRASTMLAQTRKEMTNLRKLNNAKNPHAVYDFSTFNEENFSKLRAVDFKLFKGVVLNGGDPLTITEIKSWKNFSVYDAKTDNKDFDESAEFDQKRGRYFLRGELEADFKDDKGEYFKGNFTLWVGETGDVVLEDAPDFGTLEIDGETVKPLLKRFGVQNL